MLYKVKAKFHKDLLLEFFTKLNDGTIERQKPDGLEMIASMKEAKVTAENTIEWYEQCFCETPLKHERETVFDTYLYDFQTILVDEISEDIEGESFWDYMQRYLNNA
ncbi:MAG: Unknown protein [uncultured Sulfurovum sp.]|uniref:Uncharacterized protein n=1 Tax=uncultured Sulfurovum sp. TaxID=269237 RepID=A0A6S6ULE6_9BACT|nr:MAG: Unknown protein [uncultured Sulfurovum sp.]